MRAQVVKSPCKTMADNFANKSMYVLTRCGGCRRCDLCRRCRRSGEYRVHTACKNDRQGVNCLPSLPLQSASLSPLFTLPVNSFLSPVGGLAAVKLGELTGLEVSAGLWIGDWFRA